MKLKINAMEELTLEQLKEYKTLVEKQILDIISAFEIKTKLSIDDISLEKVDLTNIVDKNKRYRVIKVEMDIKL